MAGNGKAASTRLEPSRAGQRAHDLRLGPQPEYVDADRSHLNRILIEPLTNEALRAEWEEVKKKVGKKGKIRSNQNLSYAGIIAFGHEAQKIFETLTEDEQDYAFFEVGEEIAKHFNTRLTGMVFHRDETAPHAHFQIRGIADDGTMLSQVVKRGALRKVQDITAEVMGRYAPGIERGKDKWVRIEEGEDFASTLNRSVKQLHEDLPAEIAAKEAELAELDQKIEAAQQRREKNVRLALRARDKARGQNEKAMKAAENAERYEKRAADAEAELTELTNLKVGLENRISILRAQAKDAQASYEVNSALARDAQAELDTVRDELAQKKTSVRRLRMKKDALQKTWNDLRTQKENLLRKLAALSSA